MTIKRRLFISNIMMLVIPVILSTTIMTVMIITLMGIFGISISDWFNDGEQFDHKAEQIQTLSGKWRQDVSLEQIKTDINSLETEHGEDAGDVPLAVFRDGERMYAAGNFTDSPILAIALSEPGDSYFVMDNICLYTSDAGEYKIILMDSEYQIHNSIINSDNRSYLKTLGGLLVLSVIIFILATNRFLTRMVVKSIITPLETLIYGVNQIRDGSLDYRITYTGKDEFVSVCSAFNEMAERLDDMVNARQKDENNRKELIAGISHDLRTPITSIKIHAEGIEYGVAATPQMQSHYIAAIKNKANDLEHIVSQLFLLSELDIGEFPMQMEQLDIIGWLSDFIYNVSEEYEQKGLKIELVKNIQDAMVRADIIQLKNVLTNILENSLKYCEKEQAVVRVACDTSQSDVIITLSDNGPGVPHGELNKLFNLFYRNDKARSNTSQGSGLGLAISSKIIERFNGTITAVNSPEGGLSIIITLPLEGEITK